MTTPEEDEWTDTDESVIEQLRTQERLEGMEGPEQGLVATAGSPRALAEKIAARLFTNAFAHQGTRLEIKSGIFGRHSERSLGGWSFQAAVDQIEKAIEENAPDNPQR